ncbi:MAG: CoA pyrophosphatase [Gammaproteobacteria bacterium]|nr:CoA pyrophosphatase [Gammaproteobacteria bacterium]
MLNRDSLIDAYHGNLAAIRRDSVPEDSIAGLTPSAVLIPVVDRPEGLSVLLTRRSDQLKNHAGQISFPGGRYDPEDGDLRRTALRETEEEIGLTADWIEVIGPIATWATISHFLVTPYLALVRPGFDLRLHADEVDEAFEAPLDFLLEPANQRRHDIVFEGRRRFYHEILWQDRRIWGATASMLRYLSQHLLPERHASH